MNSQFYITFVRIILLNYVHFEFGKTQLPTTTIGDTTFYVFYGPATFEEANKQCEEGNGKLAVVRNRIVAEKLKDFIRSISNGK